MRKVLELTAKNTVLNNRQCIKIKYKIYSDGSENPDYDVIIYRREEKNFHFRESGKEYFDCMLPTEDDIIFKGKLEPQYSYAEYTDYDIETDKVYIYWVGRDKVLEDISGPVPVKARDPYLWWSFEKITHKTEGLAERFPDVEILQVGETVRHKPLKAIVAGNRENLIALVGTVHACESGPEILLTFLEDMLSNYPQLLKKTGVAILPSVNADVRERMVCGAPWPLRKNENGVDLNRNFDCDWDEISYEYGVTTAMPESETYRGLYPNSEPETKALINMVEILKPKAVLSYHWLCSVTGDSALSSQKAFKDNNSQFISRVDAMTRIYTDVFRDTAKVK